MYAITPQSDVYLLKVPLEINDLNQLTFANATAQYNYFNSLPKIAYDDFTYQRKDGVLRIPACFDDIMTYNYVMYRNDAYGDKWFYAFIESMEYANDNVTFVKIRTDVWQSWQFSLTYKPTFVEREHVNDDIEGLHTVPENLELGEYEIVDLRDSPLYDAGLGTENFVPCFCATAFPPNKVANLQSNGRAKGDNGFIGGVYSTLYFFCPLNTTGADTIIKAYEDDPDITTDAIINVYMVPKCCVNYLSSDFTTIDGVEIGALYNFYVTDEFKLQQPKVLARDYIPVNKKLLTYPYSFFYVTNKSGEDVVFHYEDFPFETLNGVRGRTMTYEKKIVPSTSISAKLYFKNYKGYASDNTEGTQLYSYGINYGKLPVCAWTTDYYTNWLTQNSINAYTGMATGLVGGAIQTVGGVASGNPVSAVNGLVNIGATIANTIGEFHRAETTPPQAHGDINTGDFNYCFQRNSISFYEMSIRPEVATILDNYFSMYGYKVNAVKIPNITGRRNWNYVKTIGCYIDADIPQRDLEEIKSMFDRGITLWHNPATFADYSQNNDII